MRMRPIFERSSGGNTHTTALIVAGYPSEESFGNQSDRASIFPRMKCDEECEAAEKLSSDPTMDRCSTQRCRKELYKNMRVPINADIDLQR